MKIDGYADAPAPALQRAIGRFPRASGATLAIVFVGIAIRTGTGAYYFPQVSNVARLGILLVWLALMVLIVISLWTLWVSSRLRWYQVELRRPGINEHESTRLLHAGEKLVGISRRLRSVIAWSMKLALTGGIFGLGLMIVGFRH